MSRSHWTRQAVAAAAPRRASFAVSMLHAKRASAHARLRDDVDPDHPRWFRDSLGCRFHNVGEEHGGRSCSPRRLLACAVRHGRRRPCRPRPRLATSPFSTPTSTPGTTTTTSPADTSTSLVSTTRIRVPVAAARRSATRSRPARRGNREIHAEPATIQGRSLEKNRSRVLVCAGDRFRPGLSFGLRATRVAAPATARCADCWLPGGDVVARTGDFVSYPGGYGSRYLDAVPGYSRRVTSHSSNQCYGDEFSWYLEEDLTTWVLPSPG